MKKNHVTPISVFALLSAIMLSGCGEIDKNIEKKGSDVPAGIVAEYNLPSREDNEITAVTFDVAEQEKPTIDEKIIESVPINDAEHVEEHILVECNIIVIDGIQYIEAIYSNGDRFLIDYDQDSPCILIDPYHEGFKDIENEYYDLQMNLCKDLTTIGNFKNDELVFFDNTSDRNELYVRYKSFCDHIVKLSDKLTADEIITELNNLYVLSQNPTCLPEEAWDYYFGKLASQINLMESSLYDEYFELCDFFHNSAVNKTNTMVLELK